MLYNPIHSVSVTTFSTISRKYSVLRKQQEQNLASVNTWSSAVRSKGKREGVRYAFD